MARQASIIGSETGAMMVILGETRERGLAGRG